MGALEEQARFLTVKYGTAAGPVGLPHSTQGAPGIAAVMIGLGLLIFVVIMFLLLRDFARLSQARRERSQYLQ